MMHFLNPRHLSRVFWICFALLALVGIFASVDIGIGADEEAERTTLLINLEALQSTILGDQNSYETLRNHSDRYYGVGFHVPAFVISQFLGKLFSLANITTPITNQIIYSHISVWLCFIGAALLILAFIKKITNNEYYALAGTLCFLLWPYLFGHALMNIKDMPFLFAWLICTFLVMPFFESIYSGANNAKIPGISRSLTLGLATAWLLSIRISGVLIFIEYSCFLLCAWYFSDRRAPTFSSNFRAIVNLKNFLSFALIFLVALIAFYPIAWKNPLELLHAIEYMSKHPWVGTTLTAGRFIAPTTKLYFYLPVWLLAKLPAVVLLGIFLCPWMLYCAWKNSYNKSQRVPLNIAIVFSVSLSVITILSILALMHVALYNELRQILFIFPLLFLIGITCLYWFNKKIAFTGIVITIPLFAFDNVALYPYNYTYLNEIARQRPAIQYFETDYFGFSAGRTARWLSNHSRWANNGCIYAWPTHLLSYELNRQDYPCLIDSHGNGLNVPKDGENLLYISQRNLINFQIPAHCHLIHSEERMLPLSKNPLIMGKLYRCR